MEFLGLWPMTAGKKKFFFPPEQADRELHSRGLGRVWLDESLRLDQRRFLRRRQLRRRVRLLRRQRVRNEVGFRRGEDQEQVEPVFQDFGKRRLAALTRLLLSRLRSLPSQPSFLQY